jgi:hypothetical protein
MLTVKYLIYIKSIPNGYLNGVRTAECIKGKGGLHPIGDKLGPNIPIRMQVVDS